MSAYNQSICICEIVKDKNSENRSGSIEPGIEAGDAAMKMKFEIVDNHNKKNDCGVLHFCDVIHHD